MTAGGIIFLCAPHGQRPLELFFMMTLLARLISEPGSGTVHPERLINSAFLTGLSPANAILSLVECSELSVSTLS